MPKTIIPGTDWPDTSVVIAGHLLMILIGYYVVE